MTATIKYSNDAIDVVLAEHLHADRGLRARLRRDEGPARDPRRRAAADREVTEETEIYLTKNFGTREKIAIPARAKAAAGAATSGCTS